MFAVPRAFRLLITSAAILVVSAGVAEASSRGRGPFGLGIVLGSPTGISMKAFISNPSALQLHVGFAIGKKGHVLLAGDYLYHFHGLIPMVDRAGWLSPYVGIGARLGFGESKTGFGLRIPLGLSFQIAGAPLEIFAEVVPGMAFLPETAAVVDGGIGIRWFF